MKVHSLVRFLTIAGLAALMPAVASHAQSRASAAGKVSLRPVEVRLQGLVAGTVSAQDQPQDPAGDAAKAAAAKERFAQWKNLVYDRRPSSVLAAWAAPELKPYDPIEELDKLDPELRELILAAVDAEGGEAKPVGEEDGADGTKAKAAAGDKALEQKRRQREFEMFQRDVTLSRWTKVADFFATFPEDKRKEAYEHFLRKVLIQPVTQRVPPALQEKNRFSFEEVLVLAGMAPGGLDKKQIPLLAPIVKRAMEGGSVIEEFVRLLSLEVKKPETERRLDRREAALLLSAIGKDDELGAFLPTLEEARSANDREAFNLLARYDLAMWAKEKRSSWLERAWRVTQAALAEGEIGKDEKQEALLRAVELAPKVRAELGSEWLAKSFTEMPRRGMEIIATIGGEAAKGFRQRGKDVDYRSRLLRLQKTAVEALLHSAPELAESWRPSLALLAANWIVEADFSRRYSESTSYGPVMRRDRFGNIYWSNTGRGGSGQVDAVEPSELVDAQPGPRWVAMLGDELRPHFEAVSAQLFLKINEPERAFPFIEQLADVNPRKAKELCDEFLRVWARNNDPNANNQRTNSYMFMYGFNRRAVGIPLTRSKQERNLAELTKWVRRLRKLPIDGVDLGLLRQAFMAAHSEAEVFRLDTLEQVFGDIGELDPVQLAELLSTMRTNLATVWREPAVQEANKTKRSDKEILAEVARGYESALELARKVMDRQGDHWALLALTAAIEHDQNNFRREQKRDSGFAEARRGAFDLFQRAAEDYVRRASDLRRDQETLKAFDTWFYAALGACDLGAITEETVVAKNELSEIKAAIASLPDGSRERHEAMFANALFTRMSAVRPQIKHRYLEAGFAIVGDHPQAREARKVFDYYNDLTRELRLECVVDGSTEVGTKEFGVRVDIVHTRQIERESGGFAKYAQNQNNMNYAFNYGRPLENYRDRFSENVEGALGEHFEVLSLTWNGEQMRSEPTEREGWRRTPYAYVLLRARGPEVDRIPVIQMDFDFMDTTGYAILPISSAPVAIDASSESPDPRPYEGLQVTQLLDERRADEGRITLEIRAKAVGLVPDLDRFLALDLPGFKIASIDDQGSTVDKFADDPDRVESERIWLLSLEPADGVTVPDRFIFGRPKLDDMTAVYQRYDDADLATVSAEVALGVGGSQAVPTWFWVVFGGALFAYTIWFFTTSPGGRRSSDVEARLAMPAAVTPFTVLGLLREIEKTAPLQAEDRDRLRGTIRSIEVGCFGRETDATIDLEAIAREWLGRAG